jgi:tetratricopeptide (TPR) repeat protein
MPTAETFLDVQSLIERSQARPRAGWFRYALGIFLLIVLGSAYLERESPALQQWINTFSAMLMLGLMITMAFLTWLSVQNFRLEQQHVQAAEELVQLRRWEEAAARLQSVLSRPMRSPQLRAQSLIYLSAVLARYHRYDDAINVQNYLLNNIPMDPRTTHSLRLGRAMAMLQEDHLVDADRAMSELRRGPEGADSGGLALLEIYRDVKTGHPDEAVKVFEEKLSALRQQLGHRLGDAYALVAKAYDVLGRNLEAQAAYENATLLMPRAELARRYAEVASLQDKYALAVQPAEAA